MAYVSRLLDPLGADGEDFIADNAAIARIGDDRAALDWSDSYVSGSLLAAGTGEARIGEAVIAPAGTVADAGAVTDIAPADVDGVFTLQILHFSDAEPGNVFIDTASLAAALIDAFEDDFVNSLTLGSGDLMIPGPFLAAGVDPSIDAVVPGASGGQGRVLYAILNEMGMDASAVGNHEFDLGTSAFSTAIGASGSWEGALFPYLTANLDFSGDSSLVGRFTETLGPGLEDASSLAGRIAPSVVIEQSGEFIGIVAATTQLVESLSSTGGVEVDGFPTGPGANGEVNDMALLAEQLQIYVDDLIAQGVDKIILTTHLQDTRLGDENDVAVEFPGHAAEFEGQYPIVATGADGNTTLIVNTDSELTYVGRLVIDFDADGNVIADSYDPEVSGAYASTEENVADAWDTTVDNLDETAFADGTRGAEVREITDAVQVVLDEKTANVFGFSDVYLEGERAFARGQETNLGNLTADANADAARDALGIDGETTAIVSIKNGGGIRAQIGTVDDQGMKQPNPGGEITQLDVENTLRFDNKLMVFDTTAQGLLDILNSPNAVAEGNGGFIQIGGVRFSYDPTRAAGDRVRDIALINEAGDTVAEIANDGVILDGAPDMITAVILNFTAQGGDGYLIKENGENFRYLLEDGTVSGPIDESLDFTSADVVPANALGEQQAFADYLDENFATPETAYDEADTPEEQDTRIQNEALRDSTVLGFETLVGTRDDDDLRGGATDDSISGGKGDDALLGFVGNDTLAGQLNDDFLDGMDGDDFIKGQAGEDTLQGNIGADDLRGGRDNDTLTGGSGNDTLAGGGSDDRLSGETGADILKGRDGADTFAYASIGDSTVLQSGRDRIIDFDSAEGDLIDLSAIDAIEGGADNAFILVEGRDFSGVAGELIVRTNEFRTQVFADVDGDAVADFAITLDTLAPITASDFVL